MFSIMQKLVGKKFYVTKEEAQDKADVFYAVNRLTDDQYVQLTELVNTSYTETANV